MININNEDYLQIKSNSEDEVRFSIFSGITSNKINIDLLISQSKDSSSGGISIFIGTTRNAFHQKQVDYLSFEYHPTMAIKSLFNIASLAKQMFSLSKCLIVHRVGKVFVEEESIVIISTSKHRKEAMESTEFIINEVKSKVPIWKKEVYYNEDYEWKEG